MKVKQRFYVIFFIFSLEKPYFASKKGVMEDKIIEIARFESTAEAEMLVSLLKSEGIDCYVRDGLSSRTMFGYVDIGGAKVDLLSKDARRALKVMKDHDYEISEELSEIILSENMEQKTESYNAASSSKIENGNFESDIYEEEVFESEENEDYNTFIEEKAKLSKRMTAILVIMAILFGLLVFLNKCYFSVQNNENSNISI